MIIRFYDLETKETKKVDFAITAQNSPNIFLLSEDSLFVTLPLNPQDTTNTFFFDSIINDQKDTLKVRYNTAFSIFNPDCEPSLQFINLDTINQTFDSTAVVGSQTNSQIATNIEIYF